MSGFSEWKKPQRYAEAMHLLNSLTDIKASLKAASHKQQDKLAVTIEQGVFIDVVFLLLSELDFLEAQDMGLPHAYKQWQFSYRGITVRANRNASGWTYLDRIVLPDGTVIDPKS